MGIRIPHGLITFREAICAVAPTVKLAAAQKLAFSPPTLQAAGYNTLREVLPIDRKAGLAAYATAESPLAAGRHHAKVNAGP